MKPALEASLCVLALTVIRRIGIVPAVSASEVIDRLGVARSYAYERVPPLRALLEREEGETPPVTVTEPCCVPLRLENEVLRYRLEHPGSWLPGGRTVYSDDLRTFVLSLAHREGVGERLTQEEFASACGISLATLKPWWAAQRAAPLPTSPAAPADAATNGAENDAGNGLAADDTAAPSPPATGAASVDVPVTASANGHASPAEAAASPTAEQAPTNAAATRGAENDAGHGPAADETGTPSAPTVPSPPATGAASTDMPVPESAEAADSSVQATSPTTGFTLEMLRIIAEWDGWRGSFDAFVRQHLRALGLHYGKETVSQLLHLAAVRKLTRREPPAPPVRHSTFIPPPGVQWSSDGKEMVVIVAGQPFRVTWQSMVDVGSTATVGSVVRPTEDTAGVISSFREGVATTGAAPAALLLDSKAPNKSVVLIEALPPETFVMYGTLGRGQSKATIEGSFGLFAQDLGPIAAVVDTTSPDSIALSVANAVTRAYAAGRNHRPRRKDGKTPYELYRDRETSPEAVSAAVAKIRKIKEQIEARAQREAASRDPYVRATLEDACARFGFEPDGDLPGSLTRLPLATVQAAVAIYAAKQMAGSLPADAGLRYFAGIAWHHQRARELQLFEEELVSQLVREEPLVTAHLERAAAALAPLNLEPRLRAVVREILGTTAPVARVFWRRRLEIEAASIAPQRRQSLRRVLCGRVRRYFRATKQVRQQLVELLVRLLPIPASPLPAASC
ncbi:MAG TPA: hypothetical protein VMJ65_14555 [Solirubrobacteraceae bacterium]|nr:hypothetical protein [Solirubrobacteraceae bacterium]